MLVHELQHPTLSGLLDLIRLSEPGSDSAALRAVAHGSASGERVAAGGLRVPRHRRPVAATGRRARPRDAGRPGVRSRPRAGAPGCRRLAESSALTAAGGDFTAGMRRAFDDMATVGLPKDAVRRAEEKLRDTRDRWMRHNSTVLDTKSERAAT